MFEISYTTTIIFQLFLCYNFKDKYCNNYPKYYIYDSANDKHLMVFASITNSMIDENTNKSLYIITQCIINAVVSNIQRTLSTHKHWSLWFENEWQMLKKKTTKSVESFSKVSK